MSGKKKKIGKKIMIDIIDDAMENEKRNRKK